MSSPAKSFNPWPYSIIAFFAVAILGAVSFVIFCNRHGTELVTADYYEQELRYQEQMDSTQRAGSLPAPTKVAYDSSAHRITVSLPADHLGDTLRGWIELYRPSSAGLDQKHPLQVDSYGTQAIDASKLAGGLWRIRISWNAHGADYYHDQKLVVGQKSS